MKLFACDRCGQVVYFESVQCTKCGDALAYLPDCGVVSAFEELTLPQSLPLGIDGQPPASAFQARAPAASGRQYRLCRNSVEFAVCNWAIPSGDPNEFCFACRLNHVIPNLSNPKTKEAWHRMEMAERRVNVAEADDPLREKLREQLGETYRTVLGHFRHESGHYYWERLVSESVHQDRFRTLFGDERQDDDEARERHYKQGPPGDLVRSLRQFVRVDVDGLETARAYGLSLAPVAAANDARASSLVARGLDMRSFDDLIAGWIPLTVALNNMNRSIGAAIAIRSC